MIGTFPTPGRDEALYSVYAEYQSLLGIRCVGEVNEDLFGKRIKPLLTTFPRRLDYLEMQLPPTTRITSDQLIDEHTLVPLVRPFLAEQIADELANGIKGDGVGHLGNRIFGAARILQSLRYCPLCAEADRAGSRRAYWHRVHQIPGIFVCPHHQTLLEEIRPTPSNKGMATSYLSAEAVIPVARASRPIDKSNDWHALQLWLAEQIFWLLSNPCPVLNPQHLVHFYRVQLTIKGFEHIHTRRVANFVRAFAQTIQPEWVEALGWSPRTATSYWLQEVLFRGRGHVFKHLLIMRCLGVTIEEAVRTLGTELIFEPGPWPCLNPVCKNFGKAVIESYTLLASSEGLPNGDFACKCGFVYRRRGPDKVGKSRFKRSLVSATGHVWDAELTEMWSNPAISRRAIAQRLLVDDPQVLAAAKRLRLPHEDFRPCTVDTMKKQSARADYRNKHRAVLLGCLKEHPEASRLDLSRMCGGSVVWLKRWDVEWLSEHYPSCKKTKRVRSMPATDWEKMDLELATAIHLARALLLKLPGCPIRITATRLLKQTTVNNYPLRKKRLNKARAALAAAVESDESFALRQLQWFAMNKPNSKPYAILKRARVRDEWLRDPIFRAAAKEILGQAGREIDLPIDDVAGRTDGKVGENPSANMEEAA